MGKPQPAFDYDLGFGLEGEQYCKEVWHTGQHETKRKRYRDGRFYVELEHDPYRRGAWKPSGLRVTTAAFFEYVIDGSGVVVAFPSDLLRHAVEQGRGRPAAEFDGDNPTRGRLMSLNEILGASGQEGLPGVSNCLHLAGLDSANRCRGCGMEIA